MRGRKAVLPANHGLLVGDKDLLTAFAIAEEIEFCAEIYYRSKSVSEPIILSDTEIHLVEEKLKWYRQQRNKAKRD